MDRFAAKLLAKQAAFRLPVLRGHLVAWYPFLHTPAQLSYLCACLEQTRDVPGCIVEAGCYAGNTTLYLNRHMNAEGIEKRYWAIDTFAGFRDDDLEVEVARGQEREHYRRFFRINDQRWFDLAMRRDGARRVQSIAADVGAFEFSTVAPIAFCLLDVVFYRPVRLALPRIWEALSPGGVIVVDDFFDRGAFSGAGQAGREFVEARGLEVQRVHTKFGLLAKAA
jgi:O-methyltransferase